MARHAKANRAKVDLRMADDILVLDVRDDGVGFNPGALSENQMLGLAGMRERAALVGGRLDVASMPGRGTAVQFQVRLTGAFGGSI